MSASPEVVVMMRAQAIAGKESALRQYLERLAELNRSEVGCVESKVHQEVDDPAQFITLEKWATKSQYEIHQLRPHVTSFNDEAATLVQSARTDVMSVLHSSGKEAPRAPGTLPIF